VRVRDMSSAEAKREANIKAKEEAKAKEVAEIKANKAKKKEERDNQAKAEAEEKAAAANKQKEIDDKRAANIATKEGNRAPTGKAKAGKSKYSKKDVERLKKVFDDYDKDGSGKVSLEEFASQARKKKDDAAPRPGEKSTLQQRKAQEGVSIVDLSESVFHEMDADGSGEVTFEELVKLMYKYATPDEISTMLEWVAKEPEPEPEPKPGLSAESKKQILGIFKIYDKDKSGTLTIKELKGALEKTGIDPDEIKGYFSEYDTDGNNEIDKDEFIKLMESTGAFDDNDE